MSLPAKMRAQVFYEPGKWELKEVDTPQVSEGVSVVKVRRALFCASDVAYASGASKLGTESGKGPLILGHEFSGVIAETASSRFEKGQHVVGNPVVPDPNDPRVLSGRANTALENVLGVSLNGAFADYVAVPDHWLLAAPDGMSFSTSAYHEPLACGVRAVNQIVSTNPGVNMLSLTGAVIGPGNIGLSQIGLLKALGMQRVIGIGRSDYRLEKASRMGADAVISTKSGTRDYQSDVPAAVREANGGELVDAVIISTANEEAIKLAFKIVAPWGTIVLFGLPGDEQTTAFKTVDFLISELKFVGAWLAPGWISHGGEWDVSSKLLASGAIKTDEIITHQTTLEDIPNALSRQNDRVDNCVKTEVVFGN